jgi:hypothetical protein
MVYVTLSILGGVLLLITSVLDYYWSRIQTEQVAPSKSPTHPSEIPVGSKPPEDEESALSKVEPRFLGYLLGVLLQLPAIAWQLGWI